MGGKVPAADGPAVLDAVRLSKTHTSGCLNVTGTVTLAAVGRGPADQVLRVTEPSVAP